VLDEYTHSALVISWNATGMTNLVITIICHTNYADCLLADRQHN